ncbi:left-right determination factor 1 [Spea bombifrons]|uniref:left-right determination factor 1 n=1 Tax=Spea bombifrons TaxID=233779 RepID=UPI00234B483F|nr:left-right determination factor 1 [Spea bombifrons]
MMRVSVCLCWVLAAVCLVPAASFTPDEIKDALLKTLNLPEVPKLQKRDVENLIVPKKIQEKYISMLHKHRERQRRSVPSLLGILRNIQGNQAISGEVMYSNPQRQTLVFDMESRLSSSSEVTMAELKLFKMPPNLANVPERRDHRAVSNARVSICYVEILKDGTNRTHLIDSRLVPIMESGWRSFDVTSAVNYWMKSQGDPAMYLEVRVDGEKHGSYASEMAKLVQFTSQKPTDDQMDKPELAIYTLDQDEKDAHGDCSALGENKHDVCCREEHFINFRQLTWTQYWIIEPAGYNAYRCTGGCRQPKAPFLKHHYGQKTCAVVESAPLPVMYLVKKGDYTEIEVAEFPQMIVEKCACSMDNAPSY